MNQTTAQPSSPVNLDLSEIDTKQRWQQRPPKVFPSPWASEWGFDEYGLWQSFMVKGISHTMRYIPPGSFLMGSQEDEPERNSDETQHPVTLTQGFWMGETTVTQQLWLAVAGTNPSSFQEEESQNNTDGQAQLPVEKVSWNDCEQFCQQLNQLVPGLSLILPTEAQWEYACRAGTQTPFSTGEQLTTEQANYDGDDPYNNGEKGEYRSKTVAADAFTPNPWGLYQMHGNVWEWCRDGNSDYQAQPETDPVGEPDTDEQSDRVLRGGSWLGSGRFCRSASRNWGLRVGASGSIGLRVTQVEPAGE
jgi:sulfatase modifying factor 1